MYAYPIMEQIRNAIAMHPKAQTRALDLCELKGHILRVVRKMESLITDLPRGQKEKDPPDAYFIFGGYSWQESAFKIWILYFNAARRRFEFRKPSTLYGNRMAIIGDDVPDAKAAIVKLAQSKGLASRAGFNMEPFEVLRDFCRDPKRQHIGGSPQVAKVYRHLNVMPYAVYWPTKQGGGKSIMGRPLLDYEVASYLVLDPDTLTTEPFPATQNGLPTGVIALDA